MLRSHTVYTFMLAVQDSKHVDCGSMSKLDLFNEIMNYLHVVTTSCWQRLVVTFLIGRSHTTSRTEASKSIDLVVRVGGYLILMIITSDQDSPLLPPPNLTMDSSKTCIVCPLCVCTLVQMLRDHIKVNNLVSG